MTFRQVYYYWFYVYYKWLESNRSTRRNAQMKAYAGMTGVQVFLLFTLYGYYSLATGRKLDWRVNSYLIFLPIGVITLIQGYFFEFNKKWKEYVKEFDGWPSQKNKMGGRVVLIITILLIIQFFVVSNFSIDRDNSMTNY